MQNTIEKEYHRNGVAGYGFYVWLDDCSLFVQFGDEPEIKVPLSTFATLVESDLVGNVIEKGFRHGKTQFRKAVKLNDDVIVCAYDSDDETFIGVYSHKLDDVPFAALNWDLVKKGEVRFFYNSWRGDEAFWALENALGCPLTDMVSE